MRSRIRTSAPAVSFALVAALLLAACGGSSNGDGKNAPKPGTTVTINGLTVAPDPALAAMLPDQYKSAIRFVTAAPYPPFEVFDANQKLSGLDIDLGDMIAAKLGTGGKWTSVDYNAVIPALQSGKYDMVLASIGDTPEREKALDFVNYSKQGQVLLVTKGNPEKVEGLQSLCGKTLAVESGNIVPGYFDEIQARCSSDGSKPMALKELPKTSDALLALKSGGASAQYIGVATAADLKTKPAGREYDVVTPSDKPFGYLPRYVGAGIPKNAPKLRDAVKAALESLLADGTIKKLYTKYGQQQILIDKININTVKDEPLL